MCLIDGRYVFSSSSVDTPPVETIVSSVTLDEEIQEKEEKEAAVDVNEDIVQEAPSPAITQPPHTSPDLTFASEVMSNILIYRSICKKEGMTSWH